MNIRLTNAEAAEIVREHFNKFIGMPLGVDLSAQNITIEPAASADFGKKTVELTPLVLAIRNPEGFSGSLKINAIKSLRAAAESQGFFVGLADAKSFVEYFIP